MHKPRIENPASSQSTPVIRNRQTRPGVQMPGDRTRKFPEAKKAGQDVAGEANQVKITHGDSNPGKQTWKGARAGYTERSFPNYKPAPARDTFQDTKPIEVGSKPTSTGKYSGKNVHLNGDIKRGGVGPKQSVKGKQGARAPQESRSVAGVSGRE